MHFALERFRQLLPVELGLNHRNVVPIAKVVIDDMRAEVVEPILVARPIRLGQKSTLGYGIYSQKEYEQRKRHCELEWYRWPLGLTLRRCEINPKSNKSYD